MRSLRSAVLVTAVLWGPSCGSSGSPMGELGAACSADPSCREGLRCQQGRCLGELAVVGDVIWLQSNPRREELTIGLFARDEATRFWATGVLDACAALLTQVVPAPVAYPAGYRLEGAAPGEYEVIAHVPVVESPGKIAVGGAFVTVHIDGATSDELGQPWPFVRVVILGIAERRTP